MRTAAGIACVVLSIASLRAQDIPYEPVLENALFGYATQEPRRVGHCADSLRVDTLYTEDLVTGALEMQLHRYPFARYEFYVDGALYRRLDITQITDTREVGWRSDIASGDTIGVVQVLTMDTPNGAYHEFFPNGNIRIMGTLDGYNGDGTLKKVGRWREWDAEGNVIRDEEHGD